MLHIVRNLRLRNYMQCSRQNSINYVHEKKSEYLRIQNAEGELDEQVICSIFNHIILQ